MRFNFHPALRALQHSADPTPPGEADGGGLAPATEPPADSESQGDDAGDKERLKRALDAERALRKKAEGQLKQVGQVNPELLREAQAKAEAAEQQRQLAEAQANAQVRDLQRKHEEQLARVTSDLQAAKTAAEREALRIKTEREFLAAKGLVEASSIDGRTPFDYLWQLYGGQFAEDAKGLYLLDPDGTPKLDAETGKRVTPGEFFAKLRKDPVHGVHFQPEYGSGSGSRSTRDGRMAGKDLDGMSGSQLISEGLKAQGPRRR